ncbi:hypothetical protein AB0I28_28430 [Phytomonospora sp. NPDC050363]|uniref:hypothetical protein n=1 Tax=Phytomonospora sp. NPDC050363 TaxID=3155642 RepID=UPI00340C8FCF
MGGPLLWPAGEAWPVCGSPVPHDAAIGSVAGVRRERLLVARRDLGRAEGRQSAEVEAELKELWLAQRAAGAVRRDPEAPQALIGVAQLYARDVPDLRRPEGTDLLQMLWCPYEHADAEHLPAVRLVWRDSAAVTETVPDPSPGVGVQEGGFVPEVCSVFPETVVEYPPEPLIGLDLPADFDDPDEPWAIADGWKAGGWGGYCGVTDPVIPECACGARTEPLLTVGNGEWSNDYPWWKPLEEAGWRKTPEHPTSWDPVCTAIGRGYIMQIFQCAKGFDCPPTVAMT